MDISYLDVVFGASSAGGEDLELRAKNSSTLYVRSQDELAVFTGKAKGRIYNALEAYRIFGFSKLLECHIYGTAVLATDYTEPARTIKHQREQLGLTVQDVARCVELAESEVAKIEDPSQKSPIRNIEKVARTLALNDLNISEIKKYNQENCLAVRLKAFSQEHPILTKSDMLKIAEASWVIRVQSDLQRNIQSKKLLNWETFEKDDNYGSHDYPAWKHGYYLAYKTRDLLGIDHESPISSLKVICEENLEIPLVYADLSRGIAGITIGSGSVRGIVLNAANMGNTWIKRIALAHELGHLLWDSDEKLHNILVDRDDCFEDIFSGDYIEQRANAFSVEFLAPQKGVDIIAAKEKVKKSDISVLLAHFGISFTTGKYHYWNSMGRTVGIEEISAQNIEPEADWDGRERFGIDYYPCKDVPISRRGLFSKLVINSEKRGFLSSDSAASYLNISIDQYSEKKEEIESIYK